MMSVFGGKPDSNEGRGTLASGPAADFMAEAEGTGIRLKNVETARSQRGIVFLVGSSRSESGSCQSASDGDSSYLCLAA
jgi:hypothetical protein